MTLRRVGVGVGLLATVAVMIFAARAGADVVGDPDWSALADVQRVVVVTEEPDGSPRETTAWLAVSQGRGYLRTSGTHWGWNVERNRNVVVRTDDASWLLTVFFVADEDERARAIDAFRAKYGVWDVLMSPFRLGETAIMRLEPRLVR